MADSQAFSTQATNGSEYTYGSHGTKDENGVPLNEGLNVKALSTQRLEDFFANEDFKSSSPASWGQTCISLATKNMQAQIQAFDQAFHESKAPSCK